MIRSTRAGERRGVLSRLRDCKADLQYLVRIWDCPTTVYLQPSEQGTVQALPDRSYLRERRLYEYPENVVQRWVQLAVWAQGTATKLTSLADDAFEQARLLTLERQDKEKSS